MRKRQRGQSKVGWVVGVLLVAALGGGAWYALGGGGPEKAVSTFLTASAAGDTAGAKAVLAKNSQSLGSGLSQLGKLGDNKGGGAPSVGKATVEGDRAKVPVAYRLPESMSKMGGATELKLTYVAVKEDGAWKVDLVATSGEMLKGLGGLAGALKGAR